MTASTDLKFDPLTRSQLGLSRIAIAAAGSSSTDATACDAQNTVFSITSASGADGIRMSASVPLLTPIWVSNVSGANAKVYPNTGGKVNGGSTDAAETINSTTAQIWVRYSATEWFAILGA